MQVIHKARDVMRTSFQVRAWPRTVRGQEQILYNSVKENLSLPISDLWSPDLREITFLQHTSCHSQPSVTLPIESSGTTMSNLHYMWNVMNWEYSFQSSLNCFILPHGPSVNSCCFNTTSRSYVNVISPQCFLCSILRKQRSILWPYSVIFLS